MPITRAHCGDTGATVRATADGAEVPTVSATDWARVEAMIDNDIARAVADDPDAAPLLTGEWLAAGRMFWPADIAATRPRLGLSKTEFAARFGILAGHRARLEAGSPRARGIRAGASAGDRARTGRR